MILYGYAFRFLLTIFGILMIFSGIRGLLRSKMDSYNTSSFLSNVWGSIMVIVLGFLLVTFTFYGFSLWAPE